MAITTTKVKRVFRYEGTEFPDPLPGQPKGKCLDVLTVSYPQLNNAALDGPFFQDGKEVYQLKVAAGTKG